MTLSKKVCYHCRKVHKRKYDVIWGKEEDRFWRDRQKVRCPEKNFFWFFGASCGPPRWCPYKLEHAVTGKRCS
jgi:hypothetical protein